MKIKTNAYSYDFNAPNQKKPKFIVTIFNCSQSTFEYLRRTKLQYINLNDPFSEPTSVNSNITNGFGIFGAYTYSKNFIELEK